MIWKNFESAKTENSLLLSRNTPNLAFLTSSYLSLALLEALYKIWYITQMKFFQIVTILLLTARFTFAWKLCEILKCKTIWWLWCGTKCVRRLRKAIISKNERTATSSYFMLLCFRFLLLFFYLRIFRRWLEFCSQITHKQSVIFQRRKASFFGGGLRVKLDKRTLKKPWPDNKEISSKSPRITGSIFSSLWKFLLLD